LFGATQPGVEYCPDDDAPVASVVSPPSTLSCTLVTGSFGVARENKGAEYCPEDAELVASMASFFFFP
jgi:hypothetical protein